MRYAVYFTPDPRTPLASAGAAWLGRDAFTGAPADQPAVPGVGAARLADLTADPRRYGFHATLKPPFALAPGCSEADLRDLFLSFAAARPSFAARLEVGRIGGFLALVPASGDGDIRELADRAVEAFDRFRARPGEAELARRRRADLTAEEDALLLRWGYPYVFSAFRFHMTLSQRLAAPEIDAVEAAARARFDPILADPVAFDTLALFAEPEPGGPFTVLETASLSLATA